MTTKERTPHIIIIRLSSMGEVAMTVPVVAALRAAHPALRITILTRPEYKPLFKSVPNAGFLDADFDGRHKGFGGLIRLWRDMKALGVTHIADLQDSTRTRLLRQLLQMSGLRVAEIDAGRAEKRELTRKFRKVKHQLRTTVDRYRDAILRLGFDFPVPPAPVRAGAPVPEAARELAGSKNGRWIGIGPFAQYKGKIYPTNLTDQLIGLLSWQYDRVFVFGGGPYEQEFAEYMAQRHKGVVSVIGKVKLDAELDLMANLDAMVSMDSTTMHMASLVGIPVISVWGATHPYAGSYGFGQEPANAVQIDMPCRPCSLYGDEPCMYRDYRCLTRIAPQEIADKVAEVLPESTRKRRGRPPKKEMQEKYDAPVGKTDAAAKSGGAKSTAAKSGAAKSTATKPVSIKSVPAKPAAVKPESGKSAPAGSEGETVTPARSGAAKPAASEKRATEKVVVAKPVSADSGTKETAAEKVATAKPATTKSASAKRASAKPVQEVPAASTSEGQAHDILPQPKRGRGRPRKNPVATPDPAMLPATPDPATFDPATPPPSTDSGGN